MKTTPIRNVNAGRARQRFKASLVLCIAFLKFGFYADAQQTVIFTYPSYDLENDTSNVIQNRNHLDGFYKELHALRISGHAKVSIIHVGDSHIQGDYLTQPLRRNFQQQFGNAGRGLIVPGKVAGTNESYNIISSSTARWESKRCVFPADPLPIGIGGITVRQTQPDAGLALLMNDLWLDYAFNSLTLFFHDDGHSYDFAFADSTGRVLGSIAGSRSAGRRNHAAVLFPKKVGNVNLSLKRSDPRQNHGTIFGISLENGESGVVYHSVGVNGAKYKHYNAALFFAEQTAVLEPSLFIISLGTNEALDYPFVDRQLYGHVHDFVTAILKNNPEAHVILVTPPPGFYRGDQPNPGIEIVRDQVLQYAAENGLAIWDMYKVMGGREGAMRWREKTLLRPDGVHFTKEGYEYQANLFYAAFIKGYNQYVVQLRP